MNSLINRYRPGNQGFGVSPNCSGLGNQFLIPRFKPGSPETHRDGGREVPDLRVKKYRKEKGDPILFG